MPPPPSATSPLDDPTSFASSVRGRDLGDGSYLATPDDSYVLMRRSFVHGGFAMAMVIDAMARAARRPDPVTVTGHFLSRVEPREATIATNVLREGRHSTVQGVLRQDGEDRLVMTGTFGDVTAAKGPSHQGVRAPECAPWEDCVGTDTEFFQHLAIRNDPATFGYFDGGPTGSSHIVGRMRPRSDEPVAGPLLAVLADLMWSPAIEMGIVGLTWIPTVELTMHVHDVTWRGEVLVDIRIDHLTQGYATEDVEVWAGDGSRLLAVARQLALVRNPD